MDKAALEDMVPVLQQRHTDLLDEAKRTEGEFRLVQSLIAQWPEEGSVEGEVITDEGEKEQAVDAQD